MSADRFEAVILDAHIAPGHDGAAELMVRLRYPNGAEQIISLEADIGFRLMRSCGAADLSGLAGHSWRRMMSD